MMTSGVGNEIGPYKIQELVGRGGMAAVYRAYQASTDRQVAIKVMLPDVATDAAFKRRFEREARTLAALQHSHILPVFDYGEANGVSYLVMPYLPGPTLGDRLKEGRLPLDEVSRIFRQLASALDYAHSKGILHCDLKPHNIMLDGGGNVQLADFGLTRLLDGSTLNETITVDSHVIGTPAYMSPEQGQGKDLDHRSDLYSLTAILYEMLGGTAPYTAPTPIAVIYKHVHAALPPIARHRPDLPPSVQGVLRKGMAKAREDRYNSASAIADAIDAALSAPRPPVDTVQLPKLKPKPSDGELTTTQVNSLKPETLLRTVTTIVDDLRSKPKRGTRHIKQLGIGLGIFVGLALIGVIMLLAVTDSQALPFVGNPPRDATAQLVIDAHDAPVLDVAVSADGTQLMTGSSDDTARVWDLDAAEQVVLIEGHTSDVLQVGIRPDGAQYITSEQASLIFTWLQNGKKDTTNFGDASVGVTYTSDSALEITAAPYAVRVTNSMPAEDRLDRYEGFASGEAAVPEAAFDEAIAVESSGEAEFTAFAVSPVVMPDGQTDDGRERYQYAIITGDDAGNLMHWAVGRDTLFATADEALDADYETRYDYRYITVQQAASTPQNAGAGITALAFAADGETFAAADERGHIVIWELATLTELQTLPNKHGTVTSLVYSPDGRLLVAATAAGDVWLVDLNSETITTELFTGGGDPTALAFTPEGRLVAGANDGSVYIWDLRAQSTTAMND